MYERILYMKKLFSLLIAVSLIISMSVFAFAETTEGTVEEQPDEDIFDAEISVESTTSNGLGTFNYDGTVELVYTLSVNNVPDTEGGLGAVDFAIAYDEKALVPVSNGDIDTDGDKFDYNELILTAPEGWEAFGRINDGVFELAFWDTDNSNALVDASELVFKVTFSVINGSGVFSTAVLLENSVAYNSGLTVSYDLPDCAVSFDRALQPDNITKLPENALSIGNTGYAESENVIYYADSDTTVAEYISLYTDNAEKSGMNEYAIIIVDSKGMITYCNTAVEGEESDKGAVVIPAGSYIIGINKNNQSDYEQIISEAAVYKYVEIYNVNIDVSGEPGLSGALDGAGFTVIDREPIVNDGAYAVYDPENLTLMLYQSEIDVTEFKAMFKNDIIVKDAMGNEIISGLAASGAVIDFRDGVEVILVGDVNGDGKNNQYDYILVKRHYLNNYRLTGACFKAACMFNGKSVEVYDYIYSKRLHFGTLNLQNLMA